MVDRDGPAPPPDGPPLPVELERFALDLYRLLDVDLATARAIVRHGWDGQLDAIARAGQGELARQVRALPAGWRLALAVLVLRLRLQEAVERAAASLAAVMARYHRNRRRPR